MLIFESDEFVFELHPQPPLVRELNLVIGFDLLKFVPLLPQKSLEVAYLSGVLVVVVESVRFGGG